MSRPHPHEQRSSARHGAAEPRLNPYLPDWEYVPDSEPRVFGDRLFVFGSHDRFGASKFCDDDYVVWSTPLDDLGAWHDHGLSYRRQQDPTNADGSKALFAPDVVRGPDGRFYMFYGLELDPRLGVAVAEQPEGPFDYLGSVSRRDGSVLGQIPGDPFPFDPGALVDDDGRIWLYFGFVPPMPHLRSRLDEAGVRYEGCYVVEIESDMLTVIGEPVLVLPGGSVADDTGFAEHPFFEAASIRRIDDVYHLVYSSALMHELCYATSDRPDGGFQFCGILVSNADIGRDGRTPADGLNDWGNNHGGLVELDGQWYVFFHRHTNRTQFSRQGLVEPIHRDENGRFAQTELTSSGLQTAPLPGEGTYPASCVCVLRSKNGAGPLPFLQDPAPGVTPSLTQAPARAGAPATQVITNLRDGGVAGFRYFDLSRPFTLSLDVRAEPGTPIDLSGSLGGPVISSLAVAASGTVTTPVTIEATGAKSSLFFTVPGTEPVELRGFTLTTQA